MENKKALTPRKVVNSNGMVYYDDKAGAWGIIRLKADVVKEFYQLKEKRSKFSYQLVYYRTFEELENAIKEIKKTGDLPVLLRFYREEIKDN